MNVVHHLEVKVCVILEENWNVLSSESNKLLKLFGQRLHLLASLAVMSWHKRK